MSKVEIQLLLFFYEAGMTKNSLARFFEKDHTTIIHHIQKWHVVQVFRLSRSIRQPRQKAHDADGVEDMEVLPEPVIRAKTYADYLKEDHQRLLRMRAVERRIVAMGGKIDGCRIVDHSFNNRVDDLA